MDMGSIAAKALDLEGRDLTRFWYVESLRVHESGQAHHVKILGTFHPINRGDLPAFTTRIEQNVTLAEASRLLGDPHALAKEWLPAAETRIPPERA